MLHCTVNQSTASVNESQTHFLLPPRTTPLVQMADMERPVMVVTTQLRTMITIPRPAKHAAAFLEQTHGFLFSFIAYLRGYQLTRWAAQPACRAPPVSLSKNTFTQILMSGCGSTYAIIEPFFSKKKRKNTSRKEPNTWEQISCSSSHLDSNLINSHNHHVRGLFIASIPGGLRHIM